MEVLFFPCISTKNFNIAIYKRELNIAIKGKMEQTLNGNWFVLKTYLPVQSVGVN